MPERGAEGVSWLTTCPRCRTTFRVGQEQLDAHDGDVRCGKCQHVFNARAALKPEVEPELAEGPEEIPLPHEEPVSLTEEPPAPEPIAEEILLPQEEVVLLLEETAAEEPEPEFLIEEEIVLGGEPEEAAPTEPLPDVSAPSEPVEQAFAPIAEEIPQQKLRSRTWVWVLASSFLLLTFVIQALYTFRVELASRSPAMKPLLVQLCGVLQCRVSLPRHVETLGIEGSDLQSDPQRPGVLILSAVLRSRADYVQQYPLLELTLTDTTDKALVRRVFTPAEYLPKGKDPAAGMPGSNEVAIKLNLQLTDLQPVGYRLYLFYPRDAAGDS